MIKKGAIVKKDDKLYRVLEDKPEEVLMIETEISRYHFLRVSQTEFSCMEKTEDSYQPLTFMVGDDEMQLIRKKQAAIQIILEGLGDITDLGERKKSAGIEAYMRTFHVSRQTAHKDIRKFLQSGMDLFSLRDGRKSRGAVDMFSRAHKGGRRFNDGSIRAPVDPVLEKEAFEEGFRMIPYSHSLKKILLFLDYKYLTRSRLDENGKVIREMPPTNELFSERRFRRFCKEKIGDMPLRVYREILRNSLNEK